MFWNLYILELLRCVQFCNITSCCVALRYVATSFFLILLRDEMNPYANHIEGTGHHSTQSFIISSWNPRFQTPQITWAFSFSIYKSECLLSKSATGKISDPCPVLHQIRVWNLGQKTQNSSGNRSACMKRSVWKTVVEPWARNCKGLRSRGSIPGLLRRLKIRALKTLNYILFLYVL